MMTGITKTVPQIIIQRFYSSQLVPSTAAVIKVPAYVKKHVARVETRKEERRLAVLRKISRRGDLNVPVITSNQKEYNFYLGQVYNKHFPTPLISRYWMKTKSAGQKFTIVPWDANPSLPMKLEVPPILTELADEKSMSHFISEFDQMDLSQEIRAGIKAMGFHYPTPIQAMAIPKILQRNHTLCVSESGSGKTMTYIIPIMEHLRQCKDKQKRFANTPLSLIVVPGRELAEQIAVSAYQLGLSCGVSVKLLIPEGTKHNYLKPFREEPFDVLVATFGIIFRLSLTGVFNLSHLKHLVFDEADTLLDDSFLIERNKFLTHILAHDTILNPDAKEIGTQMIFVSTTMPQNVTSVFDDKIIDAELDQAVSPYAHRVLPHISQKFIRVNNANRAGALLELVNKDLSKEVPVMIFSNQSPTCDWMSHFLSENDVPHVKFHAGLSLQERMQAFDRFQSGDVDVLCCTDLASRGLDTQRVKHVINFDFPNNMSDYILRVGRTGRVGTNQGHVTNLIVSKSGVHVVQDIEMAVRQSVHLPKVNADIKKKIRDMYYRFT